MPRGNGTGPMGLGSMTGRAGGYCNGYSAPGYMNSTFGVGCGRGGGRGLRRNYWATGISVWRGVEGANVPYAAGVNPQAETRALANQIEMMEQSLKNAKERLSQLQKNED